MQSSQRTVPSPFHYQTFALRIHFILHIVVDNALCYDRLGKKLEDGWFRDELIIISSVSRKASQFITRMGRFTLPEGMMPTAPSQSVP